MDNVEQVQIDQVKNSRIFIGACASSIFIRDCVNCVFYTASRQLRLRDVTNSSFYIYSMSEVHIEYSNNVQFAPFNGGYPEHSDHLLKANLDVNRNLWYDVFDHNDPNKTNSNWSLIPENSYEQPWYPQGVVCEHAVKISKMGSISVEKSDNSMQSFSFQQLINDDKIIKAASPAKPSPVKPSPTDCSSPIKLEEVVIDSVEEPNNAVSVGSEELSEILQVIKEFANYQAGNDISVSLLLKLYFWLFT